MAVWIDGNDLSAAQKDALTYAASIEGDADNKAYLIRIANACANGWIERKQSDKAAKRAAKLAKTENVILAAQVDALPD